MSSPQDPSAAAEQARQRLHEEIERVRAGVESMLTDQDDAAIREELEGIRRYVKKRLRRSEKRTDKRLDALERRIDEVEQDRKYAEWRIHTSTEQMLDGLLKEVRAIADLLTRVR